MNRILTFSILVSLWGCSAPFRPAPPPNATDAGSVDLDADTDGAADYATCGEYFVIETDGAVTKVEWGPCHT